jgi:predicted ester cyclase
MSEANKAIIRRYREAYNSGNLDELDEILAPDWVSHSMVEGVPRTIAGAKDVHRMTLLMFPDWHSTTRALIAEGDLVVEHFTFSGTHKGEAGGLPPTGNHFDLGGVSIFRIADGKIVEHWAYADELGFLEALGLPEYLGVEMPPAWSMAYHHDPQHRADDGRSK